MINKGLMYWLVFLTCPITLQAQSRSFEELKLSLLKTLAPHASTDTVMVPFYPEVDYIAAQVKGYFRGDTLLYYKKEYLSHQCRKVVYTFPRQNHQWVNLDASKLIVYPVNNDTLICLSEPGNPNAPRCYLNGKKMKYRATWDERQRCRSLWFEWDETLRLRCMKQKLKDSVFRFQGRLLACGITPAGCGVMMQSQVFLFRLPTADPLFGDTLILSLNCPEFYGSNFFLPGRVYDFSCKTELDADLSYRYISSEFKEQDLPTLYCVDIKHHIE